MRMKIRKETLAKKADTSYRDTYLFYNRDITENKSKFSKQSTFSFSLAQTHYLRRLKYLQVSFHFHC